MNDFLKNDPKYMALVDRVQETPLIDRLEMCVAMIGKMCSEGRPPKMSIPVQYDDEDFFINRTLNDARNMLIIAQQHSAASKE